MNVHSLRFRIPIWHGSLAAALLLLSSVSVYFGLRQYLYGALEYSVDAHARAIGERLLSDVGALGESHVIREINTNYAPEVYGRFIRVTRWDGSVLYQSGPPNDRSYDPSQVSLPNRAFTRGYLRKETLANGHKMVIAALLFTADNGNRYLIESGRLCDHAQEVLRGLLAFVVLGFPFVLGLLFGGGYLLTRRALVPIDEITRQAEQITSRNLCERLPVPKTGDELERLASSLNRMIARLEGAFQQINRFSANVSHELRTPLTILRGELEGMAREECKPDLLDKIGSAVEETERLGKVVSRLLAISRLDTGEARMETVRLDLAELAISTVEQMHLLADEKSISMRYNMDGAVEVEGDPSYLGQALVNLVDNAIKYTAQGGWVELSVTANDNNAVAVLEVADSGTGIPREALPHVFDRFYRADKARSRDARGMGLGLSIVKAVCTAHRGQVEVFSTEGQGSLFRIELPLARGTHG